VKKVLFAIAISGLTAMAQSVISAKAGVIHYIEGDVKVNDSLIVMKESKFPELKNKEVLRTEEGRVELLLAPGSFLRLSDNSAVRMESNSILATRLALLEGTAIVEVMELDKLSSLEFTMGNDTVSIRKPGLYRLEMDSPSVKVYQGELAVNSNDQLLRVGEGRSMSLTGDHVTARFDKKQNMDEIVQWADLRASTLALANVHSARSVANSFSNGFSGGQSLAASGWFFNPLYNMMTYVPFGRGIFSPFGYGFYSPVTVFAIYNPPIYAAPSGNSAFGGSDRGQVGFNNSLGYNTSTMRSSSGYSGGAGPAAAAAAPVSGGERAGGSAGAGGGGGGARATGGGGGGGNH